MMFGGAAAADAAHAPVEAVMPGSGAARPPTPPTAEEAAWIRTDSVAAR